MDGILKYAHSEYERDGFKFEREGGVNEFRIITTGTPPIERTPEHCKGDTFYSISKHMAIDWDKRGNEEKIGILKDHWNSKMLKMCPVVDTQTPNDGAEQ